MLHHKSWVSILRLVPSIAQACCTDSRCENYANIASQSIATKDQEKLEKNTVISISKRISNKKPKARTLGFFNCCTQSVLTRISSYQQLLQGDKAEQQSTNDYLGPPTAQCAVKRDVGLHYAHN